MSSWPDRVVRVVARTLPAPVRARYREEWRADVAAAPALGMSAASVAAGAAVFSLTLDRDLPAVSGFAVSEQSQRHARWALVLTGFAALLGLGRTLLGDLGIEAIPLAVVLVLGAVANLWAAARLASGLARTSAALGTAGLLGFTAASTIPIVVSTAVPGSQYIPLAAIALISLAFVLGLVVWMRGVHPAAVAVLAVASLGASALLFFPLIGPFLVAGSAVLVGLLLQMRHADESRARTTRTATIAASGALLALIGLGALDTLVVTPLWMAGRDLTIAEVYARLPEGAAATGIGNVAVWAAVSLAAVIALLVVGLRFAARVGARRVILLGVALGALLLFTSPYAGGYLFQQLLESLSGARFDASALRRGLYLGALAMLAIAAFGWIAPRRVREVPAIA